MAANDPRAENENEDEAVSATPDPALDRLVALTQEIVRISRRFAKQQAATAKRMEQRIDVLQREIEALERLTR